MTNKELQELLKQYPDDCRLLVNAIPSFRGLEKRIKYINDANTVNTVHESGGIIILYPEYLEFEKP
jgi:hypothetical protein